MSVELVELFRGVAPFSDVSDAVLAEFAAACEVIELRGGTRLVRVGGHLDALYGVVHGALRLAQPNGDGGNATVREFYRGEMLGVLNMFVDHAVPVDVLAMRDSTVVRLSREEFLALTRRHPVLLEAFTHLMGERLLDALGAVTSGGLSSPAASSGNLAVIAVDDDAAPSAKQLVDVMAREPGIERVNAALVDAAGVAGDPARETAWLSSLEVGKRAVIYESGPRTPQWSARCVRQSDRLVIVAAAGDEHRGIEATTALLDGIAVRPRVDAVIVHPPWIELPSGSHAWSGIATRVHHVKNGARLGLERVARHLLRAPIGVALGGGGARGIAHLGVLAAITEAGIPIDYICGTSMGAIFAAGAAQGWTTDRMRAGIRELFGTPFALYDPTVPISSLLAGRKLDRVMRKYFGDAHIEDLWLPFFCVSTDLSCAQMVVHERGSLWKSVRASCSIPGIFPPISVDGRALVDGGLMNNLPVDLLAERCPGKIIAVDVYPYGDPTFSRPTGAVTSRLRALRTRMRGEPASPPLFDILIRSTLVGSKHRQASAASRLGNVRYLEPPVAEFGILSWRAHAELFEVGYEYAREQLARASLADLAA